MRRRLGPRVIEAAKGIRVMGIGPDAPYGPYASPASRRMTKLPSGSSR
jgi:hypothetical protein